jgi:ABC-2 type transport system ATP-binding protein
MSEAVIDVEGVEKAYRFFQLSNVTLRLEAGQIMGFVGPNGAGKSTTIRILMAMIRQDRGSVRVLGRAMPREQAAAKWDIGFVSEDMRLHTSATLAWHMRFIASIYPSWDATYAETLLRRFNLHPEQPIKALSHGERVKATLLLVLARRPRLLLLDEPTTGLDPVARHEILAELMDVVTDERRAILFSSHNTQDVEQISDQITFIDRGRIIDASDKETFLDRWRRLHLDLAPGSTAPTFPGVVETTVNGRTAIATTKAFSPALTAAYQRAGVTVREVQRMTLEEIFVANVMSNRGEPRGEK